MLGLQRSSPCCGAYVGGRCGGAAAAHMSWLLLPDPPAPSRTVTASLQPAPAPHSPNFSPRAPSNGPSAIARPCIAVRWLPGMRMLPRASACWPGSAPRLSASGLTFAASVTLEQRTYRVHGARGGVV